MKNVSNEPCKKIDRGIYQRGTYSYQVKMMVASHRISETFDSLEEARAFRDSKCVAKSMDPDFKRVLEARVKKREANKFTLTKALSRYELEVTVGKKGSYPEECRIAKLKRFSIAKVSFYSLTPNDVLHFLKALPKKERTPGNSRVVSLTAHARANEGRVFPIAKENLRVARDAALKRARSTYEKECLEIGKAPDPAFLTNLRFHDTRREATSRLFESGKFDIMEVASITGHKTLAILKDYTHLRAQKLARKMG